MSGHNRSTMDLKDSIKNTVETVKDSVNEGLHKSTAEAEHARRETAGDTMTTGEKVNSMANEVKNNVQAGTDHAKVEARKDI